MNSETRTESVVTRHVVSRVQDELKEEGKEEIRVRREPSKGEITQTKYTNDNYTRILHLTRHT